MESAESYHHEREELAEALRQLRRDAALSGMDTAARLGVSQSKISKIETGRILPTVEDVEHLLTLFDTTGDRRAELLRRAEALHRHDKNLRMLRKRGVEREQTEIGAREKGTTTLRVFHPAVVPGLLQTAEYARAVFSRPYSAASVDVPKAVAARVDRQALLYESHKRFHFLLTESALRWRICGDEAMLAQLDRLASLSTLSNVRLGIVPFSARVNEVPLMGFNIRDQREVTFEGFTTHTTLTDRRDIDFYLAIFAHFEQAAVFDDAARDLLSRLAAAYRDPAT